MGTAHRGIRTLRARPASVNAFGRASRKAVAGTASHVLRQAALWQAIPIWSPFRHPRRSLAWLGQGRHKTVSSIHPSAPFRDEHPPVGMWNPTTTLMIEAWAVPRPGRH
jgi:hypothetical protein